MIKIVRNIGNDNLTLDYIVSIVGEITVEKQLIEICIDKKKKYKPLSALNKYLMYAHTCFIVIIFPYMPKK